jgi:hypothetical protein
VRITVTLLTFITLALAPAAGFAQNAERDIINAALDKQMRSMKAQMPIEIDRLTKMTDVTRDGFAITYYYETKISESAWTDAMRKDALQKGIKSNCLGAADTRILLDHGYSLRHVYLDERGLLVCNVLITRQKCPTQ